MDLRRGGLARRLPVRYRGFAGPSAPWLEDGEGLFSGESLDEFVVSVAGTLADMLLCRPIFTDREAGLDILREEARAQLVEAVARNKMETVRRLVEVIQGLEDLSHQAALGHPWASAYDLSTTRSLLFGALIERSIILRDRPTYPNVMEEARAQLAEAAARNYTAVAQQLAEIVEELGHLAAHASDESETL